MSTYFIQPQRSEGAGFFPCEEHRAQRFAIYRKTPYRRGGRYFTVTTFIAAYERKTRAYNAFAQLTREQEPKYKLGQRMPKKEAR